MGWKFEVRSWEPNDVGENYEWVWKYQGDNKEEAFRILEEEKANGAGCVELKWR